MKLNQSSKQNQRIERISDTTLVIGTDIAKHNHVARAFNYRGIELGKRCLFQNDEQGLLNLLAWAESLKQEHGMSDVILGVEPTGHYWFPMFHFLKGRGVQVVLVNPHHVKKSKELDDNSPTKNDIKDAKVVGKLVIDGRYTEPQLPEGVYADLRVLMNQRDRLCGDLNRVKGRIHNWLDRFFPEYTQVFKDWEGKASLITLQHFPLPQDVVNIGETSIVATWKKNDVKRAVGSKRAQLLYRKAQKSIGLTEGVTAAKHELAMYLEQYAMLCRQIEQLMELVEELVKQIPGASHMMSIPCIGLITVAGFLAEVGNLSDYDHSQQIVRHAGLSLRENSSGERKGQTTISKRGRCRLRALLFRAALTMVAKNPEFRALHLYFTTRRDNPLKKKQSMIAICNKLIRVLFELGSKQKEYDARKVLGPYREAQLQATA
ncbi:MULTISPECIES: IS110 family transposase [Effusibacillus]|uniref:Transposase n=2 Tax=Effusibacillus TaxID=1502725 RepID=A0A292YJE9_9BACL|nr:IS110 family transposase [Effusibacillus lacus]TCS66101.1 transposase IS116/IS110/IS902 family protein [Effusibacillus lacus]GAX89029.1 transposase [Effusibacillus lacus]